MTLERNDIPFTPTERLFRRVPSMYIVGDVVLPDAFSDLERCCVSFNREAVNGDPAAVLLGKDLSKNAAASLRCENVPPSVASESATYDLYLQHCEEQDNPSHTEIRLRRPGEEYKEKHKPSSKLRARVRDILADLLIIEIRPRS